MNEVDPIRDQEKIKEIKEYLKANESPRNYLLFAFGINAALRISDLLSLKVNDVRYPDGKIKNSVYLREAKTEKEKTYTFSDSAKKTLKYFFDHTDKDQDDWLFESTTYPGKHIDRTWAWALIKKWAEKFEIEGNIGTHSLRKTWGYMARTVYEAPISLIMEKLNHSDEKTTLRYIGIIKEEVDKLEKQVSI